MSRHIPRRSKKSGLAPGTLVHVGEPRTEAVTMTMIRYGEEGYDERRLKTVDEALPLDREGSVTWINVDGIHRVDLVEAMGNRCGLHPLTMEDLVNTEQRPKVEEYGDYLFIVVKMLDYAREEKQLVAEQLSLIVRPGCLISFQEAPEDAFNPLRERIRNGKGRLKKEGSDYLAYALIDAIVDHYFVVLEKLGERLDLLQEELVSDPTRETLQEIHRLKRETISLRRLVWPLREVVNEIIHGESPLILESTLVYLRDVYDHTIQVIDTIETFREMLSGMVDIYLSSISNRTNEIMKVLAIITTLFMPLTFIAGVYGMNFEHMPELHWRWSYPAVLTLMGILAGSMLLFFRRKKWI